MDGTIDIDRPSDMNMSFKHYLPSLCSPMVAVADPSENVVDEAWMPVVLLLGYFCDWLTRENSLHRGVP